MKELGGKTGVLVGLDLPSVGGGTEAEVQSPQWGNCQVRGETFKVEIETADLWQPKQNEIQTSLPQPYIPRTAEARSWSLGIVEQSPGEGCS